MKGIRSIFFTVLLLSAPLIASPLPDFPFITVTGEASLEVAPDKAHIQFVIRSTAETAEVATNAVYKQSADLIHFLKTQGIDEADIDASQIDKNPLYKDYNNRTITGYEASQPVRVTINTLDTYPDVANYLFTQQFIFSINSSFDNSRRAEYEQELALRAGKDASERASNLAKALNVEIDSVYAISEAGGWQLSNQFGFSGSAVSYMRASVELKDSSVQSGQLILPKHINLQKSINVIYKLKK